MPKWIVQNAYRLTALLIVLVVSHAIAEPFDGREYVITPAELYQFARAGIVGLGAVITQFSSVLQRWRTVRKVPAFVIAGELLAAGIAGAVGAFVLEPAIEAVTRTPISLGGLTAIGCILGWFGGDRAFTILSRKAGLEVERGEPD